MGGEKERENVMNYKRITLFVMNIFTMIVSYLIAYLMRFGTDWKNMFKEGSDYTVAAFLFASFLLVFLFYPVPTPAKGRGRLHRLKEAFLFNLFLLMILPPVSIWRTSAPTHPGCFIITSFASTLY